MNQIVIEQQVNQQGVLIPDAFVIKQMSGIRELKAYKSDRSGSVGSLIKAEDVDAIISAGYDVVLTLPATFKAPVPA